MALDITLTTSKDVRKKGSKTTLNRKILKKSWEKIRFFYPKKKSSLHLLLVKDDIGITKLADFIADKVKNGGKLVRVIFKSEFNKKKMHRND